MNVASFPPRSTLAEGAVPHPLRRRSVKICGLREPEHAAAAAAVGADLLGFVFAPARRRVSPDQARRCLDAARAAAGASRFLAVGVFVDAPVAEVNGVAEAAGLDLVQLHGDESPATLQGLNRPALKAVRPLLGSDPVAVSRVLDDFGGGPTAPLAFLLDGHSPTAAGGAGVRADWRLARRLVRRHPVLLAGGLDPENVGAAIAAVRPLGVDVSSGVETAGVKDVARIVAFVAAARLGFRELDDHPGPGDPL
jgi:phosphoribosylanthranilate isomerase